MRMVRVVRVVRVASGAGVASGGGVATWKSASMACGALSKLGKARTQATSTPCSSRGAHEPSSGTPSTVTSQPHCAAPVTPGTTPYGTGSGATV